jgi:hypothetical protein
MNNARKFVFLIDGLGALVSALLLGVVLPFFQDHLGMPLPIFYGLAALAATFCIYSLSCFFLVRTHQRKWLQAVMLANLGS